MTTKPNTSSAESFTDASVTHDANEVVGANKSSETPEHEVSVLLNGNTFSVAHLDVAHFVVSTVRLNINSVFRSAETGPPENDVIERVPCNVTTMQISGPSSVVRNLAVIFIGIYVASVRVNCLELNEGMSVAYIH